MSQGIFDLSGRVAVVMGGTTGLGHAISVGLAEAGADVVASSRRLEQVERAAKKIEALGRQTLRVTSDVADRASVQALHDAVMHAFGRVDILVNAAGITFKAPALNLDEADWQRVMDTNLTGTLRACQIFGTTMVAAGYGRIVNIASLSSFVSFQGGRSLLGEQGGSGFANAESGYRVGEEARECECDCAGYFFHAAERDAGGRDGARDRTAHADADGTVRRGGRSGGSGGVSIYGGGFFCDRAGVCGGWWIPGKRGESVGQGIGNRE